ncbi:type I-E CRISPR-associated protein Cas6/Cse3/CasE [Apilactobacillus timberlakei]|uniref:type I-E CRISPR-associated protein Cas6/Cse3/CasE n=1 Tax=Apilactobacillus timberlakei TaxID=2008380 RepID=UPI00112D9CA9|nr:type I-E CRISPR-associated protein Cas6/Cse3/CasE [Apilactobacillus timberlakei]TPR19559.1 type I-E CRISPR-associated protein Cas6/Cse3/CasE [Apilactobacillus timberlakei]TPR20536.1 type I-E CRISPR-associated protein Cas6/Cse3/CasE [Apilactobacillus timberlakei]TPR22580.1 type I-E CRISPR-associated protein Cas6/Cse3/CasE [Apilactobacillus timberlakei]
MYLSRVVIDTNNRQKIQDLSQLGAYHSWVENSFPEEIKIHTRSRKLWRVDSLNNKKYLLIVSEKKPNKNNLEKYGIKGTINTINYDNFLNKLNNGMNARFKMVLNPAYSKSTGKSSGKRGKVLQCLSYENQMRYLESRSLKNGFELIDSSYTVTHKSWEVLKKSGKKACYIQKVCYEGRLVIKDIDIFKNLLCNGLGRKKAYGCGLITIIPE